MKRLALISSFVLFLLLCGTTSYWVMQFMKPVPRKVVAPPAAKPVATIDSVATLFGGAMAVNTNYQLRGIVLANPQAQSLAIIAVDGGAPQAFAINAEITSGVKLAAVGQGYVMIADNGVSKRIDLPESFKSASQNIVPAPIEDRQRMSAPPGAGPANPNQPAVPGNNIVNRRHGLRPIPGGPVDIPPPSSGNANGMNPNPPVLRGVQ